MVSDVVPHEWGHALDFMTLLGDRGTGEGTADVTALLMSHDPRIAPGFLASGDPIRDLDTTTSPEGLMTVARIRNGDCATPNGVSVHCIGLVYGQAAFELARALSARDGEQTGWRTSERLFYLSLNDAGTIDPSSPLSLYAAYLNADDDDGDLANGTPNAAEIFDAFQRHGMQQDELPATGACARRRALRNFARRTARGKPVLSGRDTRSYSQRFYRPRGHAGNRLLVRGDVRRRKRL